MKAKIFEIKRFAVHDGDGIRTTVFFKGCPLKCLWCHNPEGLEYKNDLAFYEHKCTLCGECARVCPTVAHEIKDGKHLLHREKCISCGACAKACIGSALRLYGEEVTVEELLPKLLEDRDFYESSNGGVTISGGECLLQHRFAAELLRALKAEGISTAVDTCGYIPKEALDSVIPYTDSFLYDFKAYEGSTHLAATGKDNRLILDNLKYLDERGAAIEIRIPLVPEHNACEIEKMADFMAELKNLTGVRVLPYHSYASSKYAALNMENTLPKVIPTDEEIERARDIIRARGIKVIV